MSIRNLYITKYLYLTALTMKTPSLNVFAQKTSLHMLTCDVILSVFSGVYVVFNPVLK